MDHTDLLARYAPDNVAGRPILELGARLWDGDRYGAFVTCYRALRILDDLVDDARAGGGSLAPATRARLAGELRRCLHHPESAADPVFRELRDVRAAFMIPDWPWRRWSEAMRHDLDGDGFATFRAFLRYGEGVAVGPGAIFMHLCGIRGAAGRWLPPAFDARRAARGLARFCYLVHVARDFRADQGQGIDCFADDALARFGLARADLRAIAGGAPATPAFRALMAEHLRRAARYLARADEELDRVSGFLAPPYRLSLLVVRELYRRMYEKAAVPGAIEEGRLFLGVTETLAGLEAALEAALGTEPVHP